MESDSDRLDSIATCKMLFLEINNQPRLQHGSRGGLQLTDIMIIVRFGSAHSRTDCYAAAHKWNITVITGTAPRAMQ